MMTRSIGWAGGLIALAMLGACADGQGYGGVNVGVGLSSGYGDPYYDPYWGGPRYGYGYGGWYDGFYYPGNGYWVYDRAGKRSRWNDGQRRYWEQRRQAWRNADPAQRERWRQEHRQAWQDRRPDGADRVRPGFDPRNGRASNRPDRPRPGFQAPRNAGDPNAGRMGWQGVERGASRPERAAPPPPPQRRENSMTRGQGRERAPRTQPQ